MPKVKILRLANSTTKVWDVNELSKQTICLTFGFTTLAIEKRCLEMLPNLENQQQVTFFLHKFQSCEPFQFYLIACILFHDGGKIGSAFAAIPFLIIYDKLFDLKDQVLLISHSLQNLH